MNNLQKASSSERCTPSPEIFKILIVVELCDMIRAAYHSTIYDKYFVNSSWICGKILNLIFFDTQVQKHCFTESSFRKSQRKFQDYGIISVIHVSRPTRWVVHIGVKCTNYPSERFEVFTAVTMKNGVFWVVTPCGSCKNRRFGGTWRLLH
jgi:hypothetical protein